MHHWTVHEKVDFPKFPAQLGGSIPRLLQLLILNSELKLKNFPMLDLGGSIPRLLQLVILNSELKDLR